MAIINKVERDSREFAGRHSTTVIAKYMTGRLRGERVLQISTYGSSNREVPDQASQSMVFGEEAARQLWEVLGKEFGFG